MLGLRSSRRLQQGRRSTTSCKRASRGSRRHSTRGNAPVSITCEAEVHSTHDDPSLQLRHKPKVVTMIIDDSDDETANEGNTTPPDSHSRCDSAKNKDSGPGGKSEHLSATAVRTQKATPMDVDSVVTPGAGVPCPKLNQLTTVSLGERCSGDLVQNLSSTTVLTPSMQDSGFPIVNEATGVIEGSPDTVHVVSVDTTPSMSSRTPGRVILLFCPVTR